MNHHQPVDWISCIVASCQALFPSTGTHVTELRIFGFDGKSITRAAGWFDDFVKLSRTAASYDSNRKAEGVFVTLNPVTPDLLARANNRAKEFQKETTKDEHILRRHWLPIDIDPIGSRPPGTSSTDIEMSCARELSEQIRTWLEGEHKFPVPLVGESGNGIHILYRIDLPNDDSARQLVSGVLTAIQDKFGSEQMKVDVVNANASRIWKLYGTTARKGDQTPARPWRRSQLINPRNFSEIEIVRAEQLLAVAALAKPGRPPAASANGAHNTTVSHFVDLDKLIAIAGLSVQRIEPYGGGTRYILERCLFNPDHSGTSACFGYSKTGAVYYKCHHDSCSGKGWEEAKAAIPRWRDATSRPAAAKPGRPKDALRSNSRGEKAQCMQLAEDYIEEHFSHQDGATFRSYNQEFWEWHNLRDSNYQRRRKSRTDTKCYREVRERDFRKHVLVWLKDMMENPTPKMSRDVVDCISALLLVDGDIQPPIWLSDDGGPEKPEDWISMQNGILDLSGFLRSNSEAVLLPHSPLWFSRNVLPHSYNATAECPNWFEFLDNALQSDIECINLLGEWFGYCLTADTNQQAVMILSGPPRTGKGTTLRMLRHLAGKHNCAAPRLNKLGEMFGLQGLLGKTNAICSDAHIGKGDTALGVLELIKGISGEDAVEVHRKNMTSIHCRLPIKFTLGVNEIPRFADNSGAMGSRVFIIPYENSFEGREDRKLEGVLKKEAEGIFNWALLGLRRLLNNGKFTRPGVSQQLSQEFRRLSSPVIAFIEDCCVLEKDAQIETSWLWEAWAKWCQANGNLPGCRETLGARLRSAVPGLTIARSGGGSRRRSYMGLRLSTEASIG